jgi:hypothetical protein
MKRLSLIIAGFCLAATLSLRAADETPTTEKPATKQHRTRTPEQKALLKEITTKYDANKDGKLDKEERQKISSEDKARLKKAGLNPRARGKGAKKSGSTTTPDTTK